MRERILLVCVLLFAATSAQAVTLVTDNRSASFSYGYVLDGLTTIRDEPDFGAGEAWADRSVPGAYQSSVGMGLINDTDFGFRASGSASYRDEGNLSYVEEGRSFFYVQFQVDNVMTLTLDSSVGGSSDARINKGSVKLFASNESSPLFSQEMGDAAVSGLTFTLNPGVLYTIQADARFAGLAQPYQTYNSSFNVTGVLVPIPAAGWLLGSALMGLGFLRRRSVA